MTITTEEAERLAERLANDADAPNAARYQPYTDSAMRNASAALRSFATERDALQAEKARLRQALDFYACVDHYQIHNAAEPNVVQFDRGAKARAALGETQ